MSTSDQARIFRRAMEQPIGNATDDELRMQYKLIGEEYGEFISARYGTADELKELADLVFVCFQFAVARGWDLEEALDRVFTSNMSKLVDGKPLRREDGKVLKGPNYKAPDLSDLV